MDKKLLKIAEFADNPELTQFQVILGIEDQVDDVKNLVQSIEIPEVKFPEQIDHTDKLDTILSKLNEDEDITVTLNIV